MISNWRIGRLNVRVNSLIATPKYPLYLKGWEGSIHSSSYDIQGVGVSIFTDVFVRHITLVVIVSQLHMSVPPIQNSMGYNLHLSINSPYNNFDEQTRKQIPWQILLDKDSGRSASQEIPCLSWNPNAPYCVYKNGRWSTLEFSPYPHTLLTRVSF
jgi:hypothetical protein